MDSINKIIHPEKPIRNVNILHREKLKKADRVAIWVTEKVGTMGFVFTIFFWTVFWLVWNLLAPLEWRFDAYPAFVIWLLISNMLQLILLPLLLVGQNLQGRHAETRAEVDFEVNLKSAKEIGTILKQLEYQHEIFLKLTESIKNLSEKNKRD